MAVAIHSARPSTCEKRVLLPLSLSPFREESGEQYEHRLASHHEQSERDCALLAEQRERIGRDLHDHTIGRLFGVGLSLESLAANPSGERASQRSEHAIQQIRLAMTELRSATFGGPASTAGPASIVSLRGDARRLVSEKSVFATFSSSFDFTGPDASVDGSVGAHVLAALSEAVMNIVKHARAMNVWVRLENTAQQVTFTVSDDGRGIDPSGPIGDGLRNIRFRAAQLGGSSSFAHRPGGGTIVRWAAPLRPASPKP